MKEGKGSEAALKLRRLLLENEMKNAASILEQELKKYNIDFPSHAETVIGPPVSLPSPCSDQPGGTAETSGTSGNAEKN